MLVNRLFFGAKGSSHLYDDAVKWAYMLTEKAKHKAKVLVFWEKHGIQAAMDAFSVKRSTLFLWKKQFIEAGSVWEALNEKSRAPRTKRKRLWPFEIQQEIKRIRDREVHPNLGPEKIYSLLKPFCEQRNLVCPKPRTIANLIKDMGGLRVFPQKISHFGKIKPIKRQKVLRKPKDFKPKYPGHLVALDTVERIVQGCRRYVITFEDIYTRFSFAWATKSHASKAAEEFFNLCLKVFPYSFNFLYVLTDNGSEFKKHFAERLKELHLIHFHTYPRTPQMNAHLERFNRSIQEEFIDFKQYLLLNPDEFNQKLVDYLIFYNTERVHCAFQNKLSPIQFIIQWQKSQTIFKQLEKSNFGLHYTIC